MILYLSLIEIQLILVFVLSECLFYKTSNNFSWGNMSKSALNTKCINYDTKEKTCMLKGCNKYPFFFYCNIELSDCYFIGESLYGEFVDFLKTYFQPFKPLILSNRSCFKHILYNSFFSVEISLYHLY